MSKLTGDTIKVGQRIWVVGYVGSLYKKDEDIEWVPVEVVIVDEKVKMPASALQVAFINPSSNSVHVSTNYDDGESLHLFLGDRGVRPYNYDSRPCQVFTTKEDMQDAIDSWAGKNPNFLKEAA